MEAKRISILLVVKNAVHLVKGALVSLEHQTFKNFEVIVVDGASTDGTLGVLNEAATRLPLRIISEQDRSVADGLAKAIARAEGDIVGIICADERYYPYTLERVAQWFEAEPNAVMCGGKMDFIDTRDNIIGSYISSPFDIVAHLACEHVPAILPSFFNRVAIGKDFYYDASVPTCPDYEFWGRVGFRFPASTFKRYDVSVAQAYQTRDSMSFRAESFVQFCQDKFAHLDNLLTSGYVRTAPEAVRQRASAGIHMWAAEQLNSIEPGHPDILAHCAAAARFDRSYARIARFIEGVRNVQYDPTTGIVRRNMLGARAVAVAEFEWVTPPSAWAGAAILSEQPLTVETAEAPWGYSLQLSTPAAKNPVHLDRGEYWVKLDLEVIKGRVGVSIFSEDQTLIGEQVYHQADGRSVALIPLKGSSGLRGSILVRSGGQPSSVLLLYRAQLLHDPDCNTGIVAPINL